MQSLCNQAFKQVYYTTLPSCIRLGKLEQDSNPKSQSNIILSYHFKTGEMCQTQFKVFRGKAVVYIWQVFGKTF